MSAASIVSSLIRSSPSDLRPLRTRRRNDGHSAVSNRAPARPGSRPSARPAGTSDMTPLCAPSMAPAPDRQMIADADLAAHHDEIAHLHAAGYSGLRHDHAVPPDRDVVSDLHQIVDLGALADDRVSGPAAVDRGVGADLDVVLNDDAASLRDFLMPLRTRKIAEPVLTDARAGMNDDAIADQGAEHRGAGADRAVASDRRRRGRSPRRPQSACRLRSRRRARSPPADRSSRPPRSAPRHAPARSPRGRSRRTARTAATPRETAHAPPRRRRDTAPPSPAPRAHPARRPRNAASAGRLRRASRPIDRDISYCRGS